MEKTYSFKVKGYVNISVSGKTEQEMIQKAEQFMCEADFGPLENIEWSEPKEI